MADNRQSFVPGDVEPLTETIPELHDRRRPPEGVVSRQSQAYLVIGLALLILLAVMFSKNQTRPAPRPSASSTVPATGERNQRSIEELKHELNQEQKQAEEAQRLERTRATGNAVMSPATPVRRDSGETGATPAAAEPPRDPVQDAERQLEFKARFAPNLVPPADAGVHAVEGESHDPREPSAQASSPQTITPRAAGESLASAVARASDPVVKKRAANIDVNSAYGQPYVLFEGTTIDTALLNRLDGEFSGPVKVMVTNPVYSQDRQHVLIPEGTFLFGEVARVSSLAQKRLAITFHRMLMPDGYSVDLDQFHGLDQAGETGLHDQVNHHYLAMFGTSIALGLIAGAGEATTNAGYNQSGSDMYRQGVAASLSKEGAHVLDRFINLPPTVTIREGHRIKVYLAQDLLLPAYENHTVPPNI